VAVLLFSLAERPLHVIPCHHAFYIYYDWGDMSSSVAGGTCVCSPSLAERTGAILRRIARSILFQGHHKMAFPGAAIRSSG
jgi:hypothetical protein